jgi:hypothetical protein
MERDHMQAGAAGAGQFRLERQHGWHNDYCSISVKKLAGARARDRVGEPVDGGRFRWPWDDPADVL